METNIQTDALKRALAHAESFLNGLNSRPVGSTVDLETLRHLFDGPPPEHGQDPSRVIDDLASAAQNGLLGCAGGRFFAWVIGGALPSALGADWLTTTWDQNAAFFATGPAVSVIEEVAGEWLKSYLDLPAEASFAFTSGCQMAHFTALAAARHSILHARGWNVNQEGLCGAPPIRVLANPNRHHSVDRAVRFLGLGSKFVEYFDVDAGERGRASLS